MEVVTGFFITLFGLIIAFSAAVFALVLTVVITVGAVLVAFSPFIAVGLCVWMLVKLFTKKK